MKNLILLGVASLGFAAFTSCQTVDIQPEGDAADTTVIPVDTIDLTLDSLKTGLIAFYPFDASAKDESGNGHNGLINDMTDADDRFNKPASAYQFNGITSHIKIKDAEDLRLNNTSFTANYWINVTAYNTSHGSSILHKRGSGSGNGWHLSFTGVESQNTNVGKVGRPSYGVSGGDDPFAVGDKYLQRDIWYMVTSVYNLQEQTYTTYINGVFDSVTGGIPSPNPATDADLYIGRDSIFPYDGTPPYYFMGKLDDIRLYNRILSEKEIKKLFVLTEQQATDLYK